MANVLVLICVCACVSLVSCEQEETCELIDNEVSRCIPIYECEPYIIFLKTYSNTHRDSVREILEKVRCGVSGNVTSLKVCCSQSDLSKMLPTVAPTTTTNPQTMPTELDPTDRLKSFPGPPECGYSKASFTRVVNGIPANLGDFPWMAALGYLIITPKANVTRWFCGGSLISAKHVMTAAHCTNRQGLYLVRLGELDLARNDEGAAPIDVAIKHNIPHEQYDSNTTTNDIAILVLNKEISFSDLIRPVCIPTISELRTQSFQGHGPLITGWGTIRSDGPGASHLQVAQLRVTSNAECARAYAKVKNQVIDDRVLCASHPARDACEGDSGGPLMILHKNKEDYHYFYVIGVVSFGIGCAEEAYPGVYTRVTHFIPWLEQKILIRSC